MVNVADSPAGTIHPLEPLTEQEHSDVADILRESGHLEGDVVVAYVTLREPDKQALQAGNAPREATVAAVDRAQRAPYRGVVSLDQRAVTRWDRVEQGTVPVSADAGRAPDRIRQDPHWQEALRKRGITDFENVQIDTWMPGYFDLDVEKGRRLIRGLAYVRDSVGDNGYARPVENVIAFFDLDAGEVAEVADYGVVPIPDERANYDVDSVGPLRDDLKPLDIVQEEGPSYTVDGHFVRWQRWQFRVSMHPIDGLVLHQVGYEDGGRVRSILHRASVAEMVVPYGETSPMHSWKNAFDAGEAGLGRLVNSLELGCDCLGTIYYFDTYMTDHEGKPHLRKNVICMHEEDYGILWKHYDADAGKAEVRRSRRLVVSSIHTIGNYEYGFYWYFYQDGSIQMEIKLTGILQTMAVPEGTKEEDLPHSVLISPQLAAPHHQHLFNFRLDFDVDGAENAVYETDVEPVPPGKDNPMGNAFVARSTLLDRESNAVRLADIPKSRTWTVVNPNSKNRLGQPVGYRLYPGVTQTMYAHESSFVAKRANFATKTLWVTQYDRDELHAAGDFPNQHPGGDGLPAYVAKDRPLENQDVVLWHTVGVTHIARPEDWPVMPVEYAGFSLKPLGFFERNPALDVPPSHAGDHCAADGGEHHGNGHHDGHHH